MLIISMSYPTTPAFSSNILNTSVGGTTFLPLYPYNNQASTQLRIAGIRAIGDIVREVSKGIVSALKLLDNVMKEPHKNIAKSQDNKNNTKSNHEKLKVEVS